MIYDFFMHFATGEYIFSRDTYYGYGYGYYYGYYGYCWYSTWKETRRSSREMNRNWLGPGEDTWQQYMDFIWYSPLLAYLLGCKLYAFARGGGRSTPRSNRVGYLSPTFQKSIDKDDNSKMLILTRTKGRWRPFLWQHWWPGCKGRLFPGYILYCRLYIFPEYIGQEESKYKTPIPGSHNLRGLNIYRSWSLQS